MTIKTRVVGFLQYAQGDDLQMYLQRWLAQSLRQVDGLFDPVTGHNHTGSGNNGPPVSGSGGGGTMTWRGQWVFTLPYNVNDGVSYNGSSYVAYVAVPPGPNQPPDQDTAHWALLAQAGAPGAAGATGPQGPAGATGPQGSTGATGPAGMTWRGQWQTAPTTYSMHDAVTNNGSSYMANIGNVGSPPPGNSWDTLALQGAQGATGNTGAQGPQGATGAQGPAGATGAQGPQGATGATGPAGPGVPAGGTTGQILAKSSATDYATAWQTPGAATWGSP